MFKKFKKWSIFFFLFTLIFSFPLIIHAKDSSLLNEGKPAFTLKNANSYLKEIVPLVENACGKKFNKITTVVITDRLAVANVLQTELKPQLANIYTDYSDEQLDDLCKNQASIYAISIMGKYGVIDGNIYLLPKNIYPLLKLAKINKKYAKPLLKLVIAHELTHALQDQETGLNRLSKITNTDELSAFSATIEGQATLVQEMVGQQMKLDDSIIVMSKLLSANAVKYDDPAKEMLNKILATQYEQIYLGGRNFIDFYFQQGGNQKVWEIIANPPVKTSMIAKPETYSSQKNIEFNYESLLDGLENEFGGEGWQHFNVDIGQSGLRSIYVQLSDQDREEVISQVEHIQCFVSKKDNSTSMVSLSVFKLKDPGFSQKYITLLEKMVNDNVMKLQSSNSVIISNYAIDQFTAIQGDQTHKITLSIGDNSSLVDVKQVFVRIFRGDLMLEFFFSNYDIEDSEIARCAEDIFNRYNQ